MANYPHPPKGSRHPANTHHRSGVKAELPSASGSGRPRSGRRRPTRGGQRADQALPLTYCNY